MKKIFSKEFIIGFCVILTAAILFFGIEFLKGVNIFKSANYYFATFSNVEGLAESAPVTINGFKVGLVRSIGYEYDNPGHVRVEMSLDPKLRLPVGTTAAMTTDLLGTGTIALNLAKTEQMYKPGDTLQGVTASGLMADITGSVLPAVTDLIPKVDSLLTAVTTLAADPAIASSLHRLDNVMANLEVSTRQLSATMQRVQPIVGNVDVIAANLSTASADMQTLSGRLRDLPVDSTFRNINAMSYDLARATARLNDPSSSLGQLLYSDGLYNNLNHSVQSLDSLLVDVKKNPKRYISIKLL